MLFSSKVVFAEYMDQTFYQDEFAGWLLERGANFDLEEEVSRGPFVRSVELGWLGSQFQILH